MTGRSLDYTDRQRAAHYAGATVKHECPVCLAGMSASHGATDCRPDDFPPYPNNLNGPGFMTGTTKPSGDRYTWSAALHMGDVTRREAIAAAHLTTDEIATAAARFGIVPGPIPMNAGGAESFPDRMHEAVATWSSLRAQVEMTNRLRDFRATHPDAGPIDGTTQYQAQGFRAWPGDVQADYDASAERFNLSPSGPWDGWPPIYTEGALERPDLLSAPTKTASQQTGEYPR